MSVLGEMIGNSVPHEFVHKGKTYHVSLIDQKIKLALERKVFARDKDALAAMRDIMAPDEFSARLDKLQEAYMNGEYSLEYSPGKDANGKPVPSRVLRFMDTQPGQLTLLSLLFGVNEMEMLNLAIEREAEVISLLKTIRHESFPGIKDEEEESPLAQRPV